MNENERAEMNEIVFDINPIIKFGIEDFVNDMLAELQNDYGIKSGDVSPLLCLELENAQEALRDAIVKVFSEQLWNSRGDENDLE